MRMKWCVVASIAVACGGSSLAGAAVPVAVNGTELSITGSKNDDEVGIGIDPVTGVVRVRATDVVAGAGCIADIPPTVVNAVNFPGGVTCTLAAGPTAIRASLGDGNDLLSAGDAFPGVGAAFTVPMFVNGDGGNDRIVTSSGNDVIDSGPGDDTPDGSLGDDQINGGPGDDQIYDNLGNDVISGGGDPRDFIYAFSSADGADRWSQGIASYQRRAAALRLSLDGVANDGEPGESDNLGPGITRVIGGDGADVIIGNARANIIEGGPGNNVIDGRAGSDILIADRNRRFVALEPPGLDRTAPPGAPSRGANLLMGGAGSDRLFGSRGNDRLLGGSGADRLSGQQGADRLIGGGGRDVMSGGDGADQLVARDGAVDALNCGRGRDRLLTADRGAVRDIINRSARNRCEFGTTGL